MPEWLVIVAAVITFGGLIVAIFTSVQSFLDWRAVEKSDSDDQTRVMVKSDLASDLIGLTLILLLMIALILSIILPRPLPPPVRVIIAALNLLVILGLTVQRVQALVRRYRLGLATFPWRKK